MKIIIFTFLIITMNFTFSEIMKEKEAIVEKKKELEEIRRSEETIRNKKKNCNCC